MTKIKPQVGPTGLRKWQLPESELSIIWMGPNSPIHLCLDKPGGMLTSINSRGSDGIYQTAKEAQAAVDTFVALACKYGYRDGRNDPQGTRGPSRVNCRQLFEDCYDGAVFDAYAKAYRQGSEAR